MVKPAVVDRLQQLVESPGQLAACVEDVAHSARVGLDTESNGFHAYYEKVCLLQISTPEADWAIDTLALGVAPLLPLLADRARECVLHAAEYDVLCMKRDYGFSFGRIFDTHAAAKTLGIDRVGLHDLLGDQLGVQLAVDEQRSDWGKRPLSPEQLQYAFADVRYLLPLREKLGEQLGARQLLAEAEAEFANRPPFKVLSDLFLAEAARRQPKGEEELLRVPGTSLGALKKVGPQVLEAVKKGLSAEPIPRPRPGGGNGPQWRRGSPGAPPPEVEDRYQRLRAWRRSRAEARKVEVQVIAPNAVLWAIARANPSHLDALSRVEGMDAFRLEQYGPSILEALHRPGDQQKLL